MMKKLLAMAALATMPGCCVVGATIGAATHPKEPERSHAAWTGFVVGAALDVLTIVAVHAVDSSLNNVGQGWAGSTD